MSFRLGIDIGGTFTDFILIDEKGDVNVSKIPSTPKASEQAVFSGLENLANEYNMSVKDFISNIEFFVHGTTKSTNTVIQRNGPKTGVIHTEGFRDILYLRDGFKKDRYNLHTPPPDPFIPRYLRKTVEERVLCKGEVQVPLNEDGVRDVVKFFKEEDVQSVGVCLLWSMINPIHERRIREIIKEEMPDVYVELSSDVSPAIREYPRTCATVLSAYVAPVLGEYMLKMVDYLKKNGFKYDLLIMQVTGGSATVEEIRKRPVLTIGSGPSGGPTSGIHYGEVEGDRDLMICDMGGTSFDVSLVRDAMIPMSSESQIEGMPIGVPAVDVHSVGAGGGSIAWIDPGGALQVGPRSAGSEPGPGCYGRGGEEPTVTDANVILGYLNPNFFLGGKMKLDRGLSEKALAKVAEPLGVDLIRVASAIYRIVNSNMVGAMRAVSVMRGIDPRTFTAVAGGAAGGTHATKIAEELGMGKVICPATAGGLCAFGLLAADVRHDYLTTDPMTSTRLDIKRVNKIFKDMEARAKEDLVKEGFKPEDITLMRFVDAKYPYQLHEITVPIPSNGAFSETDIPTIAGNFHDEHERLYTYCIRDMFVDLNGWKLTAIGKTPEVTRKEQPYAGEDASGAVKTTRKVFFEKEFIDTAIYDGDKLQNGMMLNGPAVVELPTTTVVVFPAHTLRVNSYSDFVIEIPKI